MVRSFPPDMSQMKIQVPSRFYAWLTTTVVVSPEPRMERVVHGMDVRIDDTGRTTPTDSFYVGLQN